MSIASSLPPGPPIPPPEPIWRLSVDQYHEMIRTGILTSEDPVELLDGCLVRKMPKSPLHRYMTEVMRERLADMLPPGYYTDSQEPVTLPTSEPEPDVSLIRGFRADYAKRHPYPADILLLVEVADSSLAVDRGSKKRLYALAGIVEYWIVNLVDKQIEVYRQPDMATGEYVEHRVYAIDEDVPVMVAGQTIGSVRLANLWPAE